MTINLGTVASYATTLECCLSSVIVTPRRFISSGAVCPLSSLCVVLDFLSVLVAPHQSLVAFLLRRASVVVAPCCLGLSVSAYCGLNYLPHFRYQAWRCRAQIWTGCAIWVVPILLGSWIVGALEGHSIAPIRRLAGRFSLSAPPCNMTQLLMIVDPLKIS